jgi:hypothetical protein
MTEDIPIEDCAIYISDIEQLNEIKNRLILRFEKNIRGICVLCGAKTSKEIKHDKVIELKISEMINEINRKLPQTALKDTKLTYYTETTSDTEKTVPTKQEFLVKGYTKREVEKFSKKHFPTFKGSICKQCKDDFTSKVSKCFQLVEISEDINTVYNSMKQCHNSYLDLVLSYFD